MNKSYIQKEKLKEAIIATMGNIGAIARILDVSRQAVANAIKRYKLESFLQEAEELRIDFVEEKLIESITQLNPTSIIFFLKTKGRKRGYVETYEIDAKNVKLPDWFSLSSKDKYDDER